MSTDPSPYRLQVEAELCRRSFPEFMRRAWHILEPSRPLIWGWPLDALTEHLTAVHNGEITRFLATIPPGPMRDDSIVETSRGSKLLRDVTTDDHVLTHTGKYRPVTDVHDQGTLPILEIKTFSGRTVHAAPTHPFLAPTGWVEAQHLRVDDHLTVVNTHGDQLRKKFTRVTWEDPIVSIEPSEPARCMCLTVDTDHSFTCSGIAVKNSTKSLTTRVFSPVWGWLQNPHSRYIGASYAHHLSTRDNRRAQQLITSDWFRQRFPELKIDPRRQAVENFGNNQTGWMLATSVEGIGTGERGDQFVIDDPLSAKQADSPTYRQAALKWFYETVPSRLNDLDSGQILIIMQRLHEEDVANAAIELGYDHLNIPMHFDTEQIRKPTSIGWTDPRTKQNQLMWPERFSESAVIKLEQSLGPYASAAQLEQTPVPRTGGLIETDLIIMKEQAPASIMDPDNPNIIRVRAWDFAGSKGKGAYTVGALLATDITDPDRSLYILDVRRQRLNPAGVRALVSSTAEDDPPGTVILYPKDPGQSGLDQVQSYATLLEGYSHKAEPQTGSKEERAEPFAAKVGASQVYLLEKGWTDHYKQELRFFPKGKYKDQVDATASAYNEIARRLRHKRTPEVRLVSESQSNRAKVN